MVLIDLSSRLKVHAVPLNDLIDFKSFRDTACGTESAKNDSSSHSEALDESQMVLIQMVVTGSRHSASVAACCSVLQLVAVCCSRLQGVAVCYSWLQRAVVQCNMLQCIAMCCGVLQCVVLIDLRHSASVAACCSVLQLVAVCCSAI